MIVKIKEAFLKEKQGIYEAISRDYKQNDMNVQFQGFLDIFKQVENEDIVKNNQPEIITVIYNGNPYITLKLLLKGIISNNNLVLISENIMNNLNKQIIDIMNKYIISLNLQLFIKWYPDGDISNVSKLEEITNKILFLGDKRIYRKLKKHVQMPIIYNGYGSIIIYTDDEDFFDEQIYEIKDYAISNNISVVLYNDEISEDIEYINKDGINYICIILSNDIDKVEMFKKMVKSNYILHNDTKIKDFILELPRGIWERERDKK